ncbi:virion-associated protein [Rhizobium phage Paso]|uniref:Virion-associated protein n=1 Tax=Rhizobium phage Paso TaxID=2767574 RepID=A0A7L8G6P6_9CAUD|nr:virion-associated protein [Rhizobium phage Paso]
MWLQAGLKASDGITSFITAKRDAKYRQQLQDYNNAMTRLANAQNQNAITTNQNAAIERSVMEQFNIERSRYTTIAQAEVSAAASDTAGRSVNQTLYQVERSAEEADSNRMADLEMQLAGFQQQRLNSSMQANQQIDYSFIPSPNPVTSMLGIATDIYKVKQRNNPTTI